jgi:hypothetical protein
LVIVTDAFRLCSGTLRGHIGLIEDALDRIEGKKNQGKQEDLYAKRGKDGKKKSG